MRFPLRRRILIFTKKLYFFIENHTIKDMYIDDAWREAEEDLWRCINPRIIVVLHAILFPIEFIILKYADYLGFDPIKGVFSLFGKKYSVNMFLYMGFTEGTTFRIIKNHEETIDLYKVNDADINNKIDIMVKKHKENL